MHTAKGLSKFLALHGIQIHETKEVSELDDAVITLPGFLFIQICDYPISQGGLIYVLQREVYESGELVGSDELAVYNDRFELLKRILVELA